MQVLILNLNFYGSGFLIINPCVNC